MTPIYEIYKFLMERYGEQGWWPIVTHKGVNPTKTGSIHGYHPKDYSFPRNNDEKFEICIGAILTQNTSWVQVEKALLNLEKLKAINPEKILSIDEKKLKEAIKPAGYFNIKTRKLKEFSQFFLDMKGDTPSRDQLLDVWGVGKETADSILLYAYQIPVFVVDAYTKRIFSNLGMIDEKDDYDDIKHLFEENLTISRIIYQEFHALIVEHAKNFYKKKENYKNCPLLKL